MSSSSDPSEIEEIERELLGRRKRLKDTDDLLLMELEQLRRSRQATGSGLVDNSSLDQSQIAKDSLNTLEGQGQVQGGSLGNGVDGGGGGGGGAGVGVGVGVGVGNGHVNGNGNGNGNGNVVVVVVGGGGGGGSVHT